MRRCVRHTNLCLDHLIRDATDFLLCPGHIKQTWILSELLLNSY